MIKFVSDKEIEKMTNTIVKTFIGKHIDLSKLIAISDAQLIDHMGHGGWLVGFTIDVQLRDEPIKYQRQLDYDEYKFNGKHEIIYGEDGETPLAVERLQTQIEELIEQWKGVN
jgi:hypothetical protein